MKTFAFAVLSVFLCCSISFADDYVKGHQKDTDGDGVKDSYVDGYHRTKANGSSYDNYSTKGNRNPWTGKKGYSDPYKKRTRKSFK